MCVYLLILLVSCFFILVVLGPWEFSGGPGHILSVRMWLRCVECRAGTILFGYFVGVDGGTVQIFPFFSGSVVAVRYGRNGEGGGVRHVTGMVRIT